MKFETMQQAAASLHVMHESKLPLGAVDGSYLERELASRTGLKWVPRRETVVGMTWDEEGSVFRNKKRVLTSLMILDPIKFDELNQLALTHFGKALACGLLTPDQFYQHIINKYQYPHPAYKDNWDSWTNAGQILKPLLYIVQVLCELAKQSCENESQGVTVSDFARFAFEGASHQHAAQVASKILSHELSATQVLRTRSDEVDRKIGDMFGFLSLSGVCYWKGRNLMLNMVSRDQSGEYFHGKRKDARREIDRDILAEWDQRFKYQLAGVINGQA